MLVISDSGRLFARRAAQLNFQAAQVSTGMKGTLGVIATAYQEHILSRT